MDFQRSEAGSGANLNFPGLRLFWLDRAAIQPKKPEII